MITFKELVARSVSALRSKKLPQEYASRLKFEITEIIKQGAEAYWADIYNSKSKFSKNKNNLLLPWLLGMLEGEADCDPMARRKDAVLCTTNFLDVKKYQEQYGDIPSDFIKDTDMPDIDIDCLPDARESLKNYAIEKYGIQGSEYGSVCNVGTWQTYKFRSALQDAYTALGNNNKQEIINLTTILPENVDDLQDDGASNCKAINAEGNECGTRYTESRCPTCGEANSEHPTIGRLLEDNLELAEFNERHPEIVNSAVRLIGRIRYMGMHAGALIIADRELFGNIPLAYSSAGIWITMWSEGRNTQLSKFGFVKWDFLSLRTLEYLANCCKLIEQNRGITFGHNLAGFDYTSYELKHAGYYFDGKNNKKFIDLNDKYALRLANEIKTDTIFQFDTPTAKGILENGVRHFDDLMLFNAMGHPGPMQCVKSDSKIIIENGKKPISDLNGQKIKFLQSNGEFGYTNKYKLYKTGIKKMLKIRFKSGKEIIVSPDHRILMNYGYTKAGEIKAGQKAITDRDIYTESNSQT